MVPLTRTTFGLLEFDKAALHLGSLVFLAELLNNTILIGVARLASFGVVDHRTLGHLNAAWAVGVAGGKHGVAGSRRVGNARNETRLGELRGLEALVAVLSRQGIDDQMGSRDGGDDASLGSG